MRWLQEALKWRRALQQDLFLLLPFNFDGKKMVARVALMLALAAGVEGFWGKMLEICL